MIVVAIFGLLAALAVPSLTPLATHYRALDDARNVLAALTQGRGLAQRTNEPIEVFIGERTLVLRRPEFTSDTTPESIRKIVTTFVDDRTIHLTDSTRLVEVQLKRDGVTSTVAANAPGATLRFCPSSDTYFRAGTAQTPICGVGNLTSHDAVVVLESRGQRFAVDVRAGLGSLDLRQVQ